MYKESLRSAWAEINLSNLDFNIKSIRTKIGPGRDIIGIIKADAYGHGAVRIAEALKENGVKSFGVATLHEAIALRNADITEEIVILGLTPDLYAETLVEFDLTPVTCSFRNALAISKAANSAGKVVNGFVAIDTGMGRVGLIAEEPDSIEEVKRMNALENFKIKGLFSHFAVADEADKTYTRAQEKKYLTFYYSMISAGIKFGCRTFSNSAAIIDVPSSYFESVRPGIILYGCYPSDEVDKRKLEIKPVMSVKANIVQLKKVPPGTSISYGRKFTTERESMIATIMLGYADGYPRPYSAKAQVIARGRFAPIAGSICMDQCMIDVTDVPDVKLGDEVIIMGSDGTNTILADDIGQATGTINYEIVCAFGQRLPKVYVR